MLNISPNRSQWYQTFEQSRSWADTKKMTPQELSIYNFEEVNKSNLRSVKYLIDAKLI